MRILFAAAVLLPLVCERPVQVEGLRFVFYNVENLFDPFDDSLTADGEFLPGGARAWTWNRFEDKLNRIYKVLMALGKWEPPALVGLCEVENDFVLQRLVHQTPLRKHEYRIIHKNSPDPRGMDVALLYRPGFFNPVCDRYFRVPAGASHPASTRDILYVKGIVQGGDSIHLLINHWPSRWKGNLESRAGRVSAAGVLRHILDSLMLADEQARILVAGDFNDEIWDCSLKEVVGVERPGYAVQPARLYFPGEVRPAGSQGSLKYRGRWYGFDLILVSGALLQRQGLYVGSNGFRVFAPDFLLEEDLEWLGLRPFRTYRGYRYRGGFSDHLPVYIDIIYKTTKPLTAR